MDHPPAAPVGPTGARTRALLIAAFTVATCGLIYELLAGTIASYLLGDSVTQFSTIIGSICSPWASAPTCHGTSSAI